MTARRSLRQMAPFLLHAWILNLGSVVLLAVLSSACLVRTSFPNSPLAATFREPVKKAWKVLAGPALRASRLFSWHGPHLGVQASFSSVGLPVAFLF